MNAFIASASTIARTGRSAPVSRPKRQVSILEPTDARPPTQSDTHHDDDVEQPRLRDPTPSPNTSSRISPSPVLFSGFGGANTPSPSQSSYISFASDGSPAYIPFDISKARVPQSVSDRHVRSSTRPTNLPAGYEAELATGQSKGNTERRKQDRTGFTYAGYT